MHFYCDEHGEQEQVQHGGYSLAAGTGPDGPTPRDLEGIPFTFDVEANPDDGDLELSLADADGAEDYLAKFADWEEKVTEAAENEYEHGCPECGGGRLLWWLEDDEEPGDI